MDYYVIERNTEEPGTWNTKGFCVFIGSLLFIASLAFLSTSQIKHQSVTAGAKLNPFAITNCTEVSSLPICVRNPTIGICNTCSQGSTKAVWLQNPLSHINCTEITALPMCERNPTIGICSSCTMKLSETKVKLNPFSFINCTEIMESPVCSKGTSSAMICSTCSPIDAETDFETTASYSLDPEADYGASLFELETIHGETCEFAILKGDLVPDCY